MVFSGVNPEGEGDRASHGGRWCPGDTEPGRPELATQERLTKAGCLWALPCPIAAWKST